jgi:antitoxin ParD1/3/4
LRPKFTTFIARSVRHSLDATAFFKQDDTTGGLYRAMAFVSIAIALRAWTEHFGWTATPVKTVPGALFGLAAAFKLRPVEAGLHDAARALRRAFIPHRRDADTEAKDRDILPEPAIPPDTGPPPRASEPVPEASAPNAEVVSVETREGMAAALREAFDAGKAHKAQELKAMMAAFLDALVTGNEADGLDDRSLVREAQAREEEARLEKLLLEGLASSDGVAIDKAFWTEPRADAVQPTQAHQAGKKLL